MFSQVSFKYSQDGCRAKYLNTPFAHDDTTRLTRCTILSDSTVLKRLHMVRVQAMTMRYEMRSVMVYANDASPTACWNTFGIVDLCEWLRGFVASWLC